MVFSIVAIYRLWDFPARRFLLSFSAMQFFRRWQIDSAQIVANWRLEKHQIVTERVEMELWYAVVLLDLWAVEISFVSDIIRNIIWNGLIVITEVLIVIIS